MPARKASKATAKSSNRKVLRFAHPFFTTVPHNRRRNIPGVGKRMTEYVGTKLEKIPDPQREPTMTLEEIIGKPGVTAIKKAKAISFHAVGDTGHPNGEMEELVADAMSGDYKAAKPEKSPAFFLHMGDVNYYKNNDAGYHEQFYVPYKKYPGKIIAIPGNHDGELYKFDGTSSGQKNTLDAFRKNFCPPKPSIPPAAGTIYREMVSQPGVYWLLNAPFVDIVALYSNVAEGPGYIAGKNIGQKQKGWLIKTLTAIQKERDKGNRKALLIVVHHPPFSNGGHASSTDMLKDIDDACKQSSIMSDAVLAAHAHDYQRYTRFVSPGGKKMEIPFIVAGSGGRGLSPHVGQANGKKDGDHTYDKSLRGYGYLTVTVTDRLLTISFTQVDKGLKKPFDKVVVDLKTNLLR
ncbi:MAG: metallophosphoesterase [Ignavibacteria bacterium]|nr:metallophosphoesterase [Ignavibacteria bacterium]MBI3764973.1 metallophosphoesterase [Ignavibacteriales bacterium]